MTPVTKAYLPDKEKYKNYVDRIFQSGWLTNSGNLLGELEEQLKVLLGVKHVICVANGTLALQLAYKALELSGDVITTPFSFPATASTLVWEGLKPTFADIDPMSFNISPDNIEAAITPDTSAIVPVHVFGNPCKVEEIDSLAATYGLKVVYDAAHALGTNYTNSNNGKNESVLSYGDISTLSFHSTKLLHTVEGGAVITNCDLIAKKTRLLMNFGITGINSVESLGINAKMNEFEAAMGLCILDELEKINTERREIVQTYQKELNGFIQFQQWNSNSQNNNAYAPVLFESEESLLTVEKQLNKHNIFPRRYFYPSLDTVKYLQNYPMRSMKNSRSVSSRILCLPIYSGLDFKKQEQIIDTIKEHYH